MRAVLLLLASLQACSGAGDAAIPRFHAGSTGVEPDPLILEKIETAYAAAEHGTPGALLELAKTYEANTLGELAAETYRLCLVRGGAELGEEPARVQHHIGCSLEETTRAAEALAAFEEVRRVAPGYGPAHWRAGNLLFDAGRVAEARAAFERALELEPEAVPAQLGLARVELSEGEPARARERLEPLAARAPDERFVHGLLARARRATGDERGANAALAAEERAARTNWIDPWAAEVRRRTTGVSPAMKEANERLVSGDARGAVAVLEPVVERLPDNLPATQLLIKAHIEAGALERASAELEEARRRFPPAFRLELYGGLIAKERRDFVRAKRELEGSLALNPSYGPALAALGEVELSLGNKEASESAFARALEQGVRDLRTRILLAQARIQLGRFPGAVELLREACAEFPSSAVPLAHLAEAHARAGELEAARAALAEAERLDPAFPYLAKVRPLLEGR